MKHHNNPHTPVLLDDVIEQLKPKPGDRYLDLTAGFGGHAQAIFNITKMSENSVLVDRDRQAIDYLNANFKGASIIHSDFEQATNQLLEREDQFELILMDLGVSSLQLDQVERGFSFRSDAALDMRMDQSQSLSAQDVINRTTQSELADIIYNYGEEPKSRQLAKLITDNRPITSTQQLADLISKNISRGKIHPATRTFQAIRIHVNDELGQLERTLENVFKLLSPGGRLAIISFHSLEDRTVKKVFRELTRSGYESQADELTKKPISGNKDVNNPRARSAKLRAVVKKTKTKKKGD